MYTKEHQRRINQELISAGLTRYTLLKNEARHLPNVIHEDEHIRAAINGRSATGSVMLVATDRRVIFLDCKSFYTTSDEISYDVVAGVMYHVQGMRANVILHTRVGEYNLRLVNKHQAEKFVGYIENRRLEIPAEGVSASTHNASMVINQESRNFVLLDKSARGFLQTHNVGVLSTIDQSGKPHGSVIYYSVEQEAIYFLTKSETTKAKNILTNPQVALTVFEEYSLESLQIRGIAETEHDQSTIIRVFQFVTREHQYDSETTTPPVTKIRDGSYAVFRVTIEDVKYQQFKSK